MYQTHDYSPPEPGLSKSEQELIELRSCSRIVRGYYSKIERLGEKLGLMEQERSI